ncbi:hypothetical protein [Phyllobacterium zundukense]|uniref:Uncharacterized protein n=1 Tax=Phyllobacterium zundukense TaxID=1867719 RepID=A0ACD4CXH2_9HYPH|nr:hypothetical protein [Phyllobacterium zundukense]UXN58302.1 hypothetical protein N8E88_05705 [Phyllobacterium zundukense]
MVTIQNVMQQPANAVPSPSEAQQQFDAALDQAVLSGGSSLIAQEMMKIANEMLNEAMSEDE